MSFLRAAGFLAAALLAFVFFSTAPALAQERILDFDVKIVIETDGAVSVSEAITVKVEGDQIKRGIFRDIPVGSSGRGGFEVIEVTRNGKPEPWDTESISDGVRIRIGDPDVLLPERAQTYVIRYRMEDQVGYADDHDEIYWNATGNHWAFPIDRARALVILPGSADVLEAHGYTGYKGENRQDYVQRAMGDKSVLFETTAVLRPGEGLTVAVGFPKGVVTPPSTADRLIRHGAGMAAMVGFGGLLLVLLYYLIAWNRVGRDPKGGPVIAQWESKLPPAAMRYLDRMGFDSMAFVTAIVSMAAKGWLRIEEADKKKYSILLRDDVGQAAKKPLSPGEQKLLDKLFTGGERSFKVEQANRTTLQKVQAALKSHLQSEYGREFFSRNRIWFIPGIVLTLLVWVAVAAFGNDPEVAIFMSLWLGAWTFGCAMLLWKTIGLWRDFFAGRGWKNLPGAIIFSLFTVPFLGAWIFGASEQIAAIGAVGLIVLVLACLINIVFFKLLEARTPLGRAQVDEIEGMRLYLSVAEKDRLAFHHPPERTPEHFEALLPYAVALGVEDQWAQQFEDVFQRIMAETNQAYRPHWYGGTRFSGSEIGNFGRAFSGSVAAGR
ncbi:MAG: DUF2207 domain-containing protein [Rhodospirillaceae bacterium]|nr:DUF2207 domain-containing protein [Rhodospirillaceae bacterium]